MHNIVYHGKCHEKSCNSHYGGQTKCRIEKRVIQHNRTDINSHFLKHANEVRHERVCGLRISRFWVVVIPATSKGRLVNHYLSTN